ncbi:CPLN1 protein, partial [Psilopogon haemacephalus]|nr:CPLN1 protein [Psilopogon haemacephalus]
SLSDGLPSQTVVSTKSSVASNTSICAKNQEDCREEVPAEDEQNTSGTVKKMLEDEMWKLVQLQQINFMSLMQIVQSSVTNLPNVQQILEQHQSAQLNSRQPARPTEGNGSLKTQLPT